MHFQLDFLGTYDLSVFFFFHEVEFENFKCLKIIIIQLYIEVKRSSPIVNCFWITDNFENVIKNYGHPLSRREELFF